MTLYKIIVSVYYCAMNSMNISSKINSMNSSSMSSSKESTISAKASSSNISSIQKSNVSAKASSDRNEYVQKAKKVIQMEITEVQNVMQRIDGSLTVAIDLMMGTLATKNKIVVCGVGKSGHVATKFVGTLNSIGVSACVLNVLDAVHGDLGLINTGDLIIMFSLSGETEELVRLIPHLTHVRMIAITGNLNSTLARAAMTVLDVGVEKEACPLGLAPTSSCLAMMAMADALAMVLLEARGDFGAADFAKYHPGGSLGRTLLTKVRDIMRVGVRLALVGAKATILEAVYAMTQARSGCVLVVNSFADDDGNDDGTLMGIFTQGDFTRAFEKDPQGISSLSVSKLMTRTPVSIGPDNLVTDLFNILMSNPVDDIVVVDADNKPVGIIDTQDLSAAAFVKNATMLSISNSGFGRDIGVGVKAKLTKENVAKIRDTHSPDESDSEDTPPMRPKVAPINYFWHKKSSSKSSNKLKCSGRSHGSDLSSNRSV